jgi:uncharacterized lipoprotein YajG
MRIGIIILALLAIALIAACGREPQLMAVAPGEWACPSLRLDPQIDYVLRFVGT